MKEEKSSCREAKQQEQYYKTDIMVLPKDAHVFAGQEQEVQKKKKKKKKNKVRCRLKFAWRLLRLALPGQNTLSPFRKHMMTFPFSVCTPNFSIFLAGDARGAGE